MKDNARISVIIPAYNEEKDIRNCLNSLSKQTHRNLEIIVVDDGSKDKTKEIVKKFKKVRIFEQNHKGPGEARNLGAKYSRGNILVLVDADMEFDKNYIKNLIKPIINDKEGKIIGTTHDYEIVRDTKNKYSVLWGNIRVSKENAEKVVIFRAIRKDKFIELGGFDPKYGYADDQTFWFRYRIKPTVAENTICYHKNPETLIGTFKQARWIGASWKERFIVFKIPLVNYICMAIILIILSLAVFIKSIKKIGEVSFKDKFKFYLTKFLGYYIGLKDSVFKNKNFK